MLNDLRGQAVLVTGGTKGIGLAIGLAFARQGARVTLTHKWGSADEDEVRGHFEQAGAPPPRIVRADAGNDEDTAALMAELREAHDSIYAFVSNVAFALLVREMDDYKKRSLFKSIEYSAWPMVEYTRQIKAVFGSYPRYVVGMSSTGPDHFNRNYDFVAASKSVMETLCRYMSYRLVRQGVRVNVVRGGVALTESTRATFEDDVAAFGAHFNYGDRFMAAEELAGVVLALCSGLMDGVSGQVITADRGSAFSDNMMRLFEERAELDIELGKRTEPTQGDTL